MENNTPPAAAAVVRVEQCGRVSSIWSRALVSGNRRLSKAADLKKPSVLLIVCFRTHIEGEILFAECSDITKGDMQYWLPGDVASLTNSWQPLL